MWVVCRGSSLVGGGRGRWVAVGVLGRGSWMRRLVLSRVVVHCFESHRDFDLDVVRMRMRVLCLMGDELLRLVLRCLSAVSWTHAT